MDEPQDAWAADISDEEIAQYREANESLIGSLVLGVAIDSGRTTGAGLRLVFNAACAHVPEILRSRYLNRYDLESDAGRVVGDVLATKRGRVDTTVARVFGGGVEPQDLYYGALELNGAGMRYYGDICLVVTSTIVEEDQLVLMRNSYDLEREPIRGRVDGDPARMEDEARRMAGRWRNRAAMVTHKILGGSSAPADRLMTTGMVSQGVLDDEDYLEVPLPRSFSAGDVDEARTSAGDLAVESMVESRGDHGPASSIAQLLWLDQRAMAAEALHASRIQYVPVAHEGRQRL